MEIVTISSILIKIFVCLFVYPVQKLQARKATLEGVPSTANAGKVEKWETVLVLSFMSSEESGEDDNEQPVIHVKSLPWRHPQVNKFFMQMDDRIERKKSCETLYFLTHFHIDAWCANLRQHQIDHDCMLVHI